MGIYLFTRKALIELMHDYPSATDLVREILRGAGDTFCAGDDITEFNTWTPDDPYWQVRKYQETVQIIDLSALAGGY